jgi:hypothetical protein
VPKLPGEGGDLFASDRLEIVQPPHRILIIIGEGDQREFRSIAKDGRREQFGIVKAGDARRSAECNRDVARLLDRPHEARILGRLARSADDQIEENAPCSALAHRVDQLGLPTPWPRPAAEFAQGFVVNCDQHDVAARGVGMKLVARSSEHVLRQLARSGRR